MMSNKIMDNLKCKSPHEIQIFEEIHRRLMELADSNYREFHSALVPGVNNILGVRIPQLRILAKEIAKCNDWRTFIEMPDTNFYEETMLQGMTIGLTKMDIDERMKYIRMFVPRINNWAVCDIFCGELKTAVRKGKEMMWQFIQPYLKSKEEFKIRFGIVMLFHYIDEEHIDSLLKYADTFEHEAYYARMAMAWMISICFVKFPEKTMKYMEQSKLDKWTFNKALQKTIESFRVDKATKEILRTMKRQS